ncbi:hypothetical protein Cmtc_35810 [Cupriavidus sp. TKC]|nr:hypothetical protein Cmtc_35810 [Cupriavidus sp. TKC]
MQSSWWQVDGHPLPKHAAVAVVVDFTEAEAEVGAAVDGVVVARQ